MPVIWSEELKLPPENTDITLDDLLELVETAVRTIKHLQAENALLTKKLEESKDVAHAAAIEAENMAAHIKELEHARSALEGDAQWRTWFRNKYSNSTFLTYIEKAYLLDHSAIDDPHTSSDHNDSAAITQPCAGEMHA